MRVCKLHSADRTVGAAVSRVLGAWHPTSGFSPENDIGYLSIEGSAVLRCGNSVRSALQRIPARRRRCARSQRDP